MLSTLAPIIDRLTPEERLLSRRAYQLLLYAKNTEKESLSEPTVGNADGYGNLKPETIQKINKLNVEIDNILELLTLIK